MAVSGADADTAPSIKWGYFNLDHRASEPKKKNLNVNLTVKVKFISGNLAKKQKLRVVFI